MKPAIAAAICHSLLSPNFACRALAVELLVFIAHYDEHEDQRVGLSIVLNAFDQLEIRLNSTITDIANKVGRFDAWIKQLETTVAGRGRMGSTVGLSKDLKGTDDNAIHDYCVRTSRNQAHHSLLASTSSRYLQPEMTFVADALYELSLKQPVFSAFSGNLGHGMMSGSTG